MFTQFCGESHTIRSVQSVGLIPGDTCLYAFFQDLKSVIIGVIERQRTELLLIVIAPASTGSESSSRIAVTKIAHTNSGSLCSVIPGFRIFRIVVITYYRNHYTAFGLYIQYI